MMAWRMLTMRRQRMNSSMRKVLLLMKGGLLWNRTGDGKALLPRRVEGVAVDLPCGGVERWEREEVSQGKEGYERDEGVLEAEDGFMIAWLEEIE
jgi:hypothetical protein